MEEPSKKRSRNDPSRSTPTGSDLVQAATRDCEFWFEDGNIILVSGGISFRVYRGLLAEHSAVFRSMFEVAQATPDPAEHVDGCPVIALYDSPSDLRLLFRLIYPLIAYLKFQSVGVDIKLISAIIRLDHKYELKSLYDQAVNYLTTYYTTDFDSFVDGMNATEWQPEPIQAIGAINLARLTNTPSILPAAFYICATLGPDITKGFVNEDGSIEQLSPKDLHLCLTLKERLYAENARIAFTLFRSPSNHVCQSGQGMQICSNVFVRMLGEAAMGRAPHAVASDRVLDSWVENIKKYIPPPPTAGEFLNPYTNRTLCSPCRGWVQTRDRELRRAVWRALPGYIGLTIENWDGVSSVNPAPAQPAA